MTPFLAQVADPARPLIDGRRVAVVVAHPDDETIGCGALLHRLDGATLVVVTDGAPRDQKDAAAKGFASARAYAAARHAELTTARAIACCTGPVARLGIPDQGAAWALPLLVERLCDALIGYETVLTHAYEGGHPDHDATCFGVHVAARKIGAALVEMPLYRLTEAGFTPQSFPAGSPHVRVELNEVEQRRKRRMLDAYHSQRETLAPFGTDAELFRAAPVHSFTELPNDGRLFYERQGWGLIGGQWQELVGDALRTLGKMQ